MPRQIVGWNKLDNNTVHSGSTEAFKQAVAKAQLTFFFFFFCVNARFLDVATYKTETEAKPPYTDRHSAKPDIKQHLPEYPLSVLFYPNTIPHLSMNLFRVSMATKHCGRTAE